MLTRGGILGGSRGDTKLGCVLLILFFSVFSYLCYRIIPVYLEREAFQERLLTIAGDATLRRWNDRRIIQEVLEVGGRSEFRVERTDIEIKRVRGRPEVFVVVNFSRTERFPGGYLYVFHFRYVAQGAYGI